MSDDERQRLEIEAKNCDKRAEQKQEDNPGHADHLRRRADECRRQAKEEEQ